MVDFAAVVVDAVALEVAEAEAVGAEVAAAAAVFSATSVLRKA